MGPYGDGGLEPSVDLNRKCGRVAVVVEQPVSVGPHEGADQPVDLEIVDPDTDGDCRPPAERHHVTWPGDVPVFTVAHDQAVIGCLELRRARKPTPRPPFGGDHAGSIVGLAPPGPGAVIDCGDLDAMPRTAASARADDGRNDRWRTEISVPNPLSAALAE